MRPTIPLMFNPNVLCSRGKERILLSNNNISSAARASARRDLAEERSLCSLTGVCVKLLLAVCWWAMISDPAEPPSPPAMAPDSTTTSNGGGPVSVVPMGGTAASTPPIFSRTTTYHLRVDKDQNDRAVEIKLCSLQRPHMRAFHAAWFAFFTAFFMWFSAAPLLGVLQDSLGISRRAIWLSTICSDVSTVLARFVVGSACDSYGARLPMGAVLVLAAIPTALLGSVKTVPGLCLARFGIGIAGSSFVMAQYWMGKFFVKEKIGTANSIGAGWGNAGGGLAQLVMGVGLYPLVAANHRGNDDDDDDDAWRAIFVVPAVAALVVAWIIVTQSDDAPQGYYKEMKRLGTMDLTAPSMVTGTMSRNAWLLAIAYAASFGVEISLNNAGSLYFSDEFGLDVQSAAAAAATLGLTNLFARAVGGILSDKAMQYYGMQGRLALCVVTMLWQGSTALCWAWASDTLASAIVWLALTSLGIHLTEGAIFGIVPYINPAVSGQIAGLVGLGGNLGGIFFGILFMNFSYQTTFAAMGISALASTMVYGGVFIPGHSTLWSQSSSLEAMNERVAPIVGTEEDSEEGAGANVDASPPVKTPTTLPTLQEA